MRRGSKLTGVVPLVAWVACGCVSLAWAGAWRPLAPIPGQSPGSLRDFVVDPKGTPWAMARGGVYWWDGERWVQAKDHGKAFESEGYSAGLLGGPDRGAFMTQPGAKQQEGLVFRLEAGRAEKVGDFYRDSSLDYPGVYVSRSGHLFNFSRQFLAVFRDGGWHTHETPMGSSRQDVQVADFGPGSPVLFVPGATHRAIVWDGERFHADIALPGLSLRNSGAVKVCRWGKNRILFWRLGSPELFAAELVGNTLNPIKTDAISQAVAPIRTLDVGWPAPDGSVWLVANRRAGAWNELVHIPPEGPAAVVPALDLVRELAYHNRSSYAPHCIVCARDGTWWFGLGNGIASLRDGDIHFYDWREGLVERGVDWVFEAPDGQLYAAERRRHTVYRWDPAATPDRRLTDDWDEVIHYSWRDPLADFAGHLWVFRKDLPGKLSRWDGAAWQHFDVPFDPYKTMRHLVDDTGHFIAETTEPRDGAYVVGPRGCQRHGNLHDALVAAVRAGARRFKSHDLIGPTVAGDGEIWYFLNTQFGDGCHYADGKWQKVVLGGVCAVGTDEKNNPLFLTSGALKGYQKGSFVTLRDCDKDFESKFLLHGDCHQKSTVRLVADLPESLRSQFTVMIQTGSYRGYPATWEEAEEIRTGRRTIPSVTGGLAGMAHTSWAIPAPGGGAWIRESTVRVHRWLGEVLLCPDTSKTPLADDMWHSAGVTPAGTMWIASDRGPGHRSIFLRKKRVDQAAPRVRIRDCEVIHGRRIRVAWDPLPQDAAAIVWRTNLDGRWRRLDDRASNLPVLKPGEHEVTIEARTLDELGLLEPGDKRTVRVNVRYPRSRWAAEPPKALSDIVWSAPIDVEWTANVPRRVEWRVKGREWRPLPDSRRVPLADYNNQTVELQFRAVEEDVFVEPEPLACRVAVEVAIAPAISRRIDLIATGTEAERRQAIEDLKTVPAAAREGLNERLKALLDAHDRCRRALLELEGAAPVPGPR